MKKTIINNFAPKTGIGRYAFDLHNYANKTTKLNMIYEETQDNKINEKVQATQVLQQKYNLPIFNKTYSWFYYFPKKISQEFDLYHMSNQFLANHLQKNKKNILTHFDLAPIIYPKDYNFFLSYCLKRSLDYYGLYDYIHVANLKRKNELIQMQLKGLQEDKIVYIPLGVNQNVFYNSPKEESRKKLGLSKESEIILSVGAEETRRGIQGLFETVRELQRQRSNITLIRVGKPNPKYEKERKGLNIKYVSNLPDNLLRLYYCASDLFLWLPENEGFGYPFAEALACGCPIVANDEMGNFNEICLIAKKNDLEKIISYSLKILNSKAVAQSFIKKGIEYTNQNNVETQTTKILNLYNQALT